MKMLRVLTKITVMALAFCLLFALASCSLAGGLKLKSFTVIRSSVKTNYYVGDEIDFSGIKAMVTYTDDTLNTEYGFADLTIEYPEDITATEGNKEVTVSFMDPHLNVKQTTTVVISVVENPNAIKHQGYAVDASGMKTTYLVGDTLDFTGVKLIEKFTNGGADVEITDLSGIAYDYDETITATTGSKQIPVTYNGENAGVITITVKNPAITSIVLSTEGVQTEYNRGDVPTFDGLKAVITYENGSTNTVTAFTFAADPATLTVTCGTKDVIVQFADPISGEAQTATFTIKVDGLVEYTLDTHDMTLNYYENDEVSFEGIKVTGTYFFGNTEVIPFDQLTFVHDDNLTATAGNKRVVVKMGDTEIGSFILVIGDVPTATPNLNGVDVSYRVGETVDLSGLTLDLVYSDESLNHSVDFADITILTDLSTLTQTPGQKTVSVRYLLDGEVEILANLIVTVWGIDSYTINTDEMKTTYIVGDTLNYTGLTIYANYKDRGESVLIDLSKIRFADTNATASAGNKAILIYVEGSEESIGSITIIVEKNAVISQVVEGSFKTTYEEGETPNFEGMTLVLTYKNGTTRTLALSQLTIGNVSTATAGSYTVIVKGTDPVNNEEINASFTITVIAAKLPVTQFEDSDAISQFKNANANAGKLTYGQVGFSTQFSKATTYEIGDDNEFRFVPKFAVTDKGMVKFLTAFYADAEIYLYDGSAYKALQKTVDPTQPTVVSYYNGDVLMVTADTYYGKYDFTEAAVGTRIKISVLPSATYYAFNNLNPVTLEAKVIDAYNVYEAWQLAVVDQDSTRDDWVEFKAEHGLTDFHPAGVVFHNDIHISANDVPPQFLYVSDKPVTYTNVVTGEKEIAPAGTRYLKDELFVYSRVGSEDFTIQGNLFTLDVIKFPLIPSPAVFDESLGYDYGIDFSNSSLFAFATNSWSDPQPGDPSIITIENVASIGNAGRNNYVDDLDSLVSAGGLFFVKIRNLADLTISNSHFTSFFISMLTETAATMTLNDIKCYDSYQNALFIWGDTTCTVNNSFLNGAGGPLILCQPVNRDNTWYNPTFIVNDTKTETHLTGEEIWFNSLAGVTAIISDIKALGAGLGQAGLGNFVDKNGKMNIVSAGIPSVSDSAIDAAQMIQAIEVELTMKVNGHGLDRWQNDPFWANVYNHPAFRSMAPFLTVNDANGIHVIFFNGTTFCDIMGNPLGTQAEHAALVAAFQSADHITLSQGGLSVIFEFYH